MTRDEIIYEIVDLILAHSDHYDYGRSGKEQINVGFGLEEGTIKIDCSESDKHYLLKLEEV